MKCMSTLIMPDLKGLENVPVIIAAQNAAQKGDWNKVYSCIRNLEDASFKMATETALVIAVDRGDLEGVKLLVKYGADVNKRVVVQDLKTCEGYSSYAKMKLVGYAAMKKHWDVVKYLIEYGALIEDHHVSNVYDSIEFMLNETASQGNLSMFQYFLQNWVISDITKMGALYYLLEWQDNDTDLECIKALISAGTAMNLSNLNDEDREQFSDDTLEPLVYAALSKNIAKVQLLLDAGANLTQAIEKAEVILNEYQEKELEDAITLLKNFVK